MLIAYIIKGRATMGAPNNLRKESKMRKIFLMIICLGMLALGGTAIESLSQTSYSLISAPGILSISFLNDFR